MNDFWKSWLTLWCGALIVFGAVLVGAALPATDALARACLDLLSGFTLNNGIFDDRAMRFATALIGAVTIGWGLAMLAVVRLADASPRLWRALTGAMLVWFAVDSAASIATGFCLNAVSNTLIMALFLVPIFASGVFGGERRTARA